MAHKMTLYGLGPNRSARSESTLRELGSAFADIEARAPIRCGGLRRLHPQAKLPAAEIKGEPLFESAASCTRRAAPVLEKKLNWQKRRPRPYPALSIDLVRID